MCYPTINDLPNLPADKTGWPWTEESPQLYKIMPNGNPWPKISIVTPSYNQGQFIEETIRSVLLQGYNRLEYIIMDGGSTDESVSIIKKYEPWLTYWTSERDFGQSHAINRGFEKSSGNILGWINSDDFYLPGSFQAVAHAYARQESPAIFLGNGNVVDKEGRLLAKRNVYDIDEQKLFQWSENWFLQQACFWPRECWETVGGLDESLQVLMDYDLWLRFVAKYPFKHIDKPLGVLRYYSETKTVQKHSRSIAEMMIIKALRGEAPESIERVENLLNELEHVSMELKNLSNHYLVRMLKHLGIFPFKSKEIR